MRVYKGAQLRLGAFVFKKVQKVFKKLLTNATRQYII